MSPHYFVKRKVALFAVHNSYIIMMQMFYFTGT